MIPDARACICRVKVVQRSRIPPTANCPPPVHVVDQMLTGACCRRAPAKGTEPTRGADMSTNEREISTGAATETIPVESGTENRREDGEAIRECVLLATNGSPEADAALRFASAIAAREELLLRILTVLEPL